MKKVFTLLTLLIGMVIGVQAGEVHSIAFNGGDNCFDNSDDATYFSWNKDKHNFNSKFTGAEYDGISYSYGLKMESATQISWTSTSVATVTIVQSTWSAKTIKLDGTELAIADAAEGTGCRVYTITDVEAGSHSVTRGSGESGLYLIKVEYTGAVLTQLDEPAITVNTTTGEVTIGAVENATKITYTTDGSDPTDESTEYTAPFTVEDGITVKAVAIGDGASYINSTIASKLVLLDAVTIENPVISQFNGTVYITCPTVGTTIEYSLDGENFEEFTRAFTLTADATVYARAKRGDNTSEVVSEAVTTISKAAATKTIWMGHGSFDNNTTNSMTGREGDDAYGYTLTITGNAVKNWSSGSNKINVNGTERTTIKLSNGAQNTLTLPEGVKATRITFYSVINSGAGARTSYWKEFNGTNYTAEDVPPMGAWNEVEDRLTNPDVRVFPLNGDETEITFTNAGEQLLFIIALDVIEDPETVTVGTAGWATTVTTKALDFTGASVKAYTAKLSDNTVTLTEATQVPAGTALVLKAAAGSYDIPVIAEADAVDNDLKGSATEATVMDDANTYYGLAINGNGSAQFTKIEAGGTIAAGKAYLMVAGAAGAKVLAVSFGEATGISSLSQNAAKENAQFYNLAGQRVAQPQKGLYIVNGKKVVK